MNNQQSRTLQETRTSASPAEVIAAAKTFFVRNNSLYAAFAEQEGPTFVTFRGQGGEEIVIGAVGVDGATRVSGSSYMFDQQIARFYTTLPPTAGGAAA